MTQTEIAYSINTQIQESTLIPISTIKDISLFRLELESKVVFEFRSNGDVFWNGKLVTSDLDLVAGLTEIVASYRKDAEYRRRLTIIQNIHET